MVCEWKNCNIHLKWKIVERRYDDTLYCKILKWRYMHTTWTWYCNNLYKILLSMLKLVKMCVMSLSWWGPKTITMNSWIDFVQEVHDSVSSDTAARAVVFPKLIFWNICKAQYLSVTWWTLGVSIQNWSCSINYYYHIKFSVLHSPIANCSIQGVSLLCFWDTFS